MPEREVSQVRPALAGVEPGALVGDGRFEVRRLLRRARDKAVHLGYDRKFECEVVIDVFSNNAIMPSGLSVSAWEARVLGRLGGHPHIGTVLEHWEGPEGAFMVSRYLPGGSLHDLILRSKAAGETLPVERILTLAEQMTDGLAHIHSRRILYRDLQPKNVLLDEWGNVHLVDFDLAVSLDDRTATDASGRLDIAGRADIEYMAPELKRGDPCDERADLYSLGATLFAACCGLPPHPEIVAARAARAGAGDQSRRSADRPRDDLPIGRDDLPIGLRALVSDLLAHQRERRPSGAAEVASRLRRTGAARDDLERLLKCGETATVEFKASLRAPAGPTLPGDKRNPTELSHALESEVVETIAAFFNTSGGTLLIGVSDDRSVTGIEVDFPQVRGSADGWRLTFDNVISRDLGPEALGCIQLDLEPWEGRTVAVIRCQKRDRPTWVNDELFIRRTASTVMLSTRHAVEWCRERWGA